MECFNVSMKYENDDFDIIYFLKTTTFLLSFRFIQFCWSDPIHTYTHIFHSITSAKNITGLYLIWFPTTAIGGPRCSWRVRLYVCVCARTIQWGRTMRERVKWKGKTISKNSPGASMTPEQRLVVNYVIWSHTHIVFSVLWLRNSCDFDTHENVYLDVFVCVLAIERYWISLCLVSSSFLFLFWFFFSSSSRLFSLYV